MTFDLSFDTHRIQHARKDYGFIDLLGDIGGINYIFISGFGFFLLTLSEFSFLADVFNHLFILNKDDKWNLFG